MGVEDAVASPPEGVAVELTQTETVGNSDGLPGELLALPASEGDGDSVLLRVRSDVGEEEGVPLPLRVLSCPPGEKETLAVSVCTAEGVEVRVVTNSGDAVPVLDTRGVLVGVEEREARPELTLLTLRLGVAVEDTLELMEEEVVEVRSGVELTVLVTLTSAVGVEDTEVEGVPVGEGVALRELGPVALTVPVGEEVPLTVSVAVLLSRPVPVGHCDTVREGRGEEEMEGEAESVGELLSGAVAVVVGVCVAVAAGVPEPVVVMENVGGVVGSGFFVPLGVSVAAAEKVPLKGVEVGSVEGVALPVGRALGVNDVVKVGVEGAE